MVCGQIHPQKILPKAAVNNKDEYHPNNHHDHKQIKILRPKRKPKNIETALQNIEQQKLVSVNFYKRSGKQKS